MRPGTCPRKVGAVFGILPDAKTEKLRLNIIKALPPQWAVTHALGVELKENE